MLTLIERIFGNRKKKNSTKTELIMFDDCTLENKITFCENAIEGSNFSEEKKEELKDALRGVFNAENPLKFYYEFEEDDKYKIPEHIKKMLSKIYSEIIPLKAKTKARELFDAGHKTWMLEKPNSDIYAHSYLRDALEYFNDAFNYLRELNSADQQDLCLRIGDWFFNTAVKLKEIDKLNDSKYSLGIASQFYNKGNILVPPDVKEHWLNYQYMNIEELRTDWQTKKEDLTSIISKYI